MVEFKFNNSLIALNANNIISVCLVRNSIYINYLATTYCESLCVCDNINQMFESLKYTKSKTTIRATRNDFGKNNDGFLVKIIISPTTLAICNEENNEKNINSIFGMMCSMYTDIISQFTD